MSPPCFGPHLQPLSTPHPECPGLPETNIPGKRPDPVRDEGLGTNIPTLSLQQNLGPARQSPRGALLTEAAVRAPLCPHLIPLLPSRHLQVSTSKLTYLRGSLGGPSLRHRSSVSQAHAPACTQPRGWNGCRCGIHHLTLQGMRPSNSHAGERQTLLSAEVKRTRKANGLPKLPHGLSGPFASSVFSASCDTLSPQPQKSRSVGDKIQRAIFKWPNIPGFPHHRLGKCRPGLVF